MEDNQLSDLNKKLDQILSQQQVTQKKEDKISKNLTFLFSAALPVVIAIVGIYFTNENNRRQVEFQQIQIADGMVNEVKSDTAFNKDKLDLKLNFVQQMFQDVNFRNKVDTILTQTYLYSLRNDDLASQIQSSDPAQRSRAYQKLQAAKQFNDPKVNKLVNQIDSTPGVKTSVQNEQAKQTVQKKLRTGAPVTSSDLQSLKEQAMQHPGDSSLVHLYNRAIQQNPQATNVPNNTNPTDTSTTKKPKVMKAPNAKKNNGHNKPPQ